MPHRQLHRARRVVAGLTVAAVAVGMMVSSSAGAGSVSVTQTITDQWTSGYQAALVVRNDSGAALKAWRLEFDLPHKVTSMWDAVLVSQVNSHVVVDAPAWQRDIAGGSTTSLGYVAALSGARKEPTNCKINGLSCSFGGSTTTTSTSPSSSTSSSSSSTTVVGGAG